MYIYAAIYHLDGSIKFHYIHSPQKTIDKT